MPKRLIALLITTGFSFVAAGCSDNYRPGAAAGRALMEATLPIWLPIVLIEKAAKEHKAGEAAEEDPLLVHGSYLASQEDAEKLRADAEKGDPKAQYEIGNQYWGRGSSEEAAEGVKWYRRSAEQGFGDAQFNLGIAYQTGYGVEQDNVQADAWYITAGSSQNFLSAETINLARQNNERIEASMTPEQIAEARRRAHEWKPS